MQPVTVDDDMPAGDELCQETSAEAIPSGTVGQDRPEVHVVVDNQP